MSRNRRTVAGVLCLALAVFLGTALTAHAQQQLGAGTSTTLSNRNLIAGNGLGGLKAINGGTLNTRGNNSGEQVAPTSGTTLVGGF